VIFLSVVTVDQGERKILLRFGKAVAVLDEGLHFKIPFIDHTKSFEIRIQKHETSASAATLDLQDVKTNIALNYRIDSNKILDIYEQLGEDFLDRIIEPAIQEVMKSITAKYPAESLITQREQVREQVEEGLSQRLNGRFIIVEAVSLTDFQFSQYFNDAIEEKVIAEQKKLKAEMDLERIKIEAKQEEEKAIGRKNAEIARAQGQAQAIAIIQEELQSSPDYLQYYSIDKWDGVLPLATGEQVPMLNIN
jgi:regulator of protease activity HflC (stomatin/prohibitin superfamily)